MVVSSYVGVVSLRPEYSDELILGVVDVALQDLHAMAQETFERVHIQNWKRNQIRIERRTLGSSLVNGRRQQNSRKDLSVKSSKTHFWSRVSFEMQPWLRSWAPNWVKKIFKIVSVLIRPD